MKTWIVGLVVATTACSKTECPVIPPPAPPPAALKPSADELAIAARRAAVADVDDIIRHRGVAWRIDARGLHAETLVFHGMYIGIDVHTGADGCTAKQLPVLANEGINEKASKEEAKRWRDDLAKFTRIECDTEGSTVIALVPDATKGWVIDAQVPDVIGNIKKQAAAQSARQRGTTVPREVETDDPDRYMFTQ